jgi:hypothetical protein
MKTSRQFVVLAVVFFAWTAQAQKHPEIFDVSDVTFGAQRLPTRYLYAAGAWSDASEMENALSVQIECYKRVSHCSVARAIVVGQGPGSVGVALDGFDILRWDESEIIAVDTSAICVVNTIRADLIARTVTISSAKKATESADKGSFCKLTDGSTAFLVNHEEVTKKIVEKVKQKKP